jgi:outer membrane protein TolC
MRAKTQRAISLCISIALILFLSVPVLAEQQAEKKAAPQGQDIPIENNQITLGLKSTLMLGLKNNLNIAFQSYNPQIVGTGIERAKSEYDTLLKSDFIKNRSRQQVGNTLSGGSATEVYQERYNLNTAIQKRFTPGTSAELKLNNEQYKTDLSFQGLVPQYKSELILSLTQPLLKDFGIDIGTSRIRIANLNQQMSAEQFRQSAMDIMYRIELFYWNLYFQNQDLKSKQISLKLAQDLLREIKIKIDAGTLAPVEIYQAEQNVAARQEDIIVSKRRVQDAEDFLKSALNLYEKQQYWNVSIIPEDKPDLTEVHPQLDECIKVALEKRPDFIMSKLDIKATNIQVKYTKNQTLPRIDLVGSIGTSGIAGRPTSSSGLYGGILDTLIGTQKNPYSGHWDDVYDSLGSRDYYSYVIGLKLEIPLENKLARSNYTQAKLQEAQALTQLKLREVTIINEVRDSVREVETNLQRQVTARAILKFSQETLAAETKKYEVGMSTQRDVLDFQDRLQKAMSNMALTESDYARSVSNLARVKGILFEEKGLTM